MNLTIGLAKIRIKGLGVVSKQCQFFLVLEKKEKFQRANRTL